MRAALLVTLIATTTAKAADPPAGYEVRTLKGFTVLLHESVVQQRPDRWGRRPIDVLETEFDDLKRVMAPKLLDLLRQVPVYVNWDYANSDSAGVVAVYRSSAAAPKPSPDDLKANCIEIVTLRRLGELRPPGSHFQQIVTLHEMAHAVHHRLLGWDAPEVKAAFQQAVERRLYDDSWDRTNRRGKAYARTNDAEYFAEISCAYLDSCHWYPFTFSDLKNHDPAGFALAGSVWKHPERFAGRKLPPVQTPHFRAPDNAAVARSGPAAEQEAFAHLDRARTLIRQGKADDARKALEKLVAAYPATMAAEDARNLLARSR